MAMNSVYYRFRHLLAKKSYSAKPARSRMNRILQPKTAKVTFELVCLAVRTINRCEACMQSHERAVLESGLTEDHVRDAVRIAATIRAAWFALDTQPRGESHHDNRNEVPFQSLHRQRRYLEP
jgi:alkyl hydroperoxide reductase subunit D